MTIARLPNGPAGDKLAKEAPRTQPHIRSAATGENRSASPLEGELMDLYASFLIVVPAALLLNSLWP